MGKYRRLDDDDTAFFRAAVDKQSAFKEINRRHQLRDGDATSIPYYLSGMKRDEYRKPTYRSGRLYTNSAGQVRRYLDWEAAEDSSSSVLPLK